MDHLLKNINQTHPNLKYQNVIFVEIERQKIVVEIVSFLQETNFLQQISENKLHIISYHKKIVYSHTLQWFVIALHVVYKYLKTIDKVSFNNIKAYFISAQKRHITPEIGKKKSSLERKFFQLTTSPLIKHPCVLLVIGQNLDRNLVEPTIVK